MNGEAQRAAGRRGRVLVIGSSFGAYGGIEAFMFETARRAALDGRFDVRLLFKLARGCEAVSCLRGIAQSSGMPVEFAQGGGRAVLRAVAWADLVHAQNAPPDVCFPAWLLSRPLVLSIHNRFLGGGSVRGALWRWGASLADVRLFNSRFVRESWGRVGQGPGSRVAHTVSELSISPAPLEGRRGFSFVGRMIPNKGADLLVEAYFLAGLDPEPWPLMMIGDGPLREGLEERVRASGRAGIRFTGFVSTETKFECLRSAKWLVAAPNTSEDMGLTPLEARSQGIPCIVSDDGGLPEVAGAGALVCRRGDVGDLARALREAAAMGEAAYAERAHSSHDSLAEDLPGERFYPELYASILEKRRGGCR